MPFDMSGPRRERDAARRKLAKDRAEHIVGHLCAITRRAMDEGRVLSPLNCQAVFRQTIRAELCLQSWPWKDADRAAMDVVAVVLAILQAKRPSWAEGQPDHVIERGTLVKRTRCANCGNSLPTDRPKFCSTGCKNVHGLRLLALRTASEEQMARLATASLI